MGTKDNPGSFDCYERALQDEPRFTLLARDPDFHRLVKMWAERRAEDIHCGLRPMTDMGLVQEAMDVALRGQTWRRENDGKWREPAA